MENQTILVTNKKELLSAFKDAWEFPGETKVILNHKVTYTIYWPLKSARVFKQVIRNIIFVLRF